MPDRPKIKKWINDVFFSFPFQLIILHLRNNQLLLLFWIFLSLLMTGVVGKSFGIRYLFLDPEYLGEVDFGSFFILGITFGSFWMSWNLATYLLSTHYFPFLASLKRPFTKFCLNNSLIPFAFLLVYIGFAIHFQTYYEYWSADKIIVNMAGLVSGIILTISLYSFYFQFTNRDISYYERKTRNIPPDKIRGIAPGHRGVDLEVIKQDKNRWRVDTYLTETMRPRMVRSVAHYDNKLLFRIFRQNHMNALLVQSATILILLGLGYLMDYAFFRIPAGASIFILASIGVAVLGALHYWLHRWRVTVVILLVIAFNYVTKSPVINLWNRAYGLDYTTEPASYSGKRLREMCSTEQIREDIDSTRVILDNWRRKFGRKKPKMVIMSVSGGGLKASVWTMQVLRKCDSLLNGKLMQHTILVTGASGGIMGASYFRELHLRKLESENIDPYEKLYLDKMSQDLLNSVAFAIASNDIFFPVAKFDYDGKAYIKDRGYMFEKQLNENTDYLMDKPLIAYRQPEREAIVPMIIISPSIVNDARRLLISPQGVSYLASPHVNGRLPEPFEADAVDFRKIFHEQDGDSLRFTTAIRMSATYPYILPNVHLPSQPAIEVMDAGFRDNMGLLSTTRFILTFENWIKENTSGVVLIQISSIREHRPIPASDNKGIIESLFNPLGILTQIVRLQDFEHDTNIGFVYDLLGSDHFKVIRFTYDPSPENERASMTFHLTQREKNDILNSFYLPFNQESYLKLAGELE